MSLRVELEKLAASIVKQANGPDVALDARIEALKVGGAFFAILERVRLKSNDDEPGSNFNDFRDQIHGKEPAHGRPTQPLPGGRRDS